MMKPFCLCGIQPPAEPSVGEGQELADIYVERGRNASLGMEVATQLMVKDALGAHARDELGVTDVLSAKFVQAAQTLRSALRPVL